MFYILNKVEDNEMIEVGAYIEYPENLRVSENEFVSFRRRAKKVETPILSN